MSGGLGEDWGVGDGWDGGAGLGGGGEEEGQKRESPGTDPVGLTGTAGTSGTTGMTTRRGARRDAGAGSRGRAARALSRGKCGEGG